MLNKKFILFDLDGTLTNPYEGITKSVQYSLASFGIDEKQENLKRFIGPPLTWAFKEYYGFNDETTAQAIKKYRERFSEKGIFENDLYEGIPELLDILKKSGKEIILATSKPIEFSEKIIDYFGLTKYFSFMAGSTLKGERDTKAEVIEYALNEMNITDLSQAVMIGDREHDIYGAKANNIESIGILYGFGNREEFEKARADYICDTVKELENLILR